MKPSTRKRDKEWADAIKQAAGYRCSVIGCKRVATDAHHLESRRYEANRYGPGIALCRYHHRMLHDCPWKYEVDPPTKTVKEVKEA